MITPGIVDALAELDPQPRARRWTSLSYCLLDATWSIGARYDTVVVPLVVRVAADNGDAAPSTAGELPLPADPLPLTQLLARYRDEDTLRHITNGQRTSTNRGITKADAVLLQARILVDHQVNDLADVHQALTGDGDRWAELNRQLATVPGEGQHGVRRGYLWMLCGADDLVKPDRMVLRWLARHGLPPDASAARQTLKEAAAELTVRLQRPVTPWMVDHAIWTAERPGRRRDGLV